MKYITTLIIIIFIISCTSATESGYNSISVEIKNTKTYEYKTGMSGDEQGANILTQAEHFERSEIIRDSATIYEPVYYYKAKEGYTGRDFVEIIKTDFGIGNNETANEIVRINFIIIK